MKKNALVVAILSACAALPNCGVGGNGSGAILVGSEGTGTGGQTSAVSATGGASTLHLDGGVSTALAAHIESPPGVTVQFITLACANACADVLAVATGGALPYQFVWEDGSTTAERHVCPTESTRYSLTVRDAGVSTGELRRDPVTATAALSAAVVKCPDVSSPDAGAGAPGGPLCLANGSFEGTAVLNDGTKFDAAPWTDCDWSPDVYDAALGGLPPTDGATYLSLETLGPALESTEQALCAPIAAGETVHFLIDLAAWVGAGLELEFYGSSPANCAGAWGTSPGAGDQLLGATAPVMETGKWTTQCVTLHAESDVNVLKLRRRQRSDLATFLYIDNIRPVPACP